jgi:4-amino-4-deoxy-L-arabinose transferase-like glycosyltransferase
MLPPSTYPVGTSLLLTPFVAIGGWQASALGAFAALVMTILVLRRWLRDQGRSPAFALLFLCYPAALVLSRIAMSDLPSAAAVTVGLWLFFRSDNGDRRSAFLSGLAAGASLLFRETNALPFVPFFAGAAARRERRTWFLAAGVAMGIFVRLLSNRLMQGHWLFLRDSGYGFSAHGIAQNGFLYLAALLVFLPGGLLWVLTYRGRHRWEVISSVLMVLAFFLAYDYGGHESGGLRRLVLGPRYFLPILPLMALAAGESVPRLWLRLMGGWHHARRLERLAVAALGLCLTGLAFAVHPVLASWGRDQLALQSGIYGNTRAGGAVLTNLVATGKYFNEIYGDRRVLNHGLVKPEQVPQVLAAHGSVQIAFVERADSEFFVNEARSTRAYVESARGACRIDRTFEADYPGPEKLLVYDVRSCPVGR